MEDKTILDLYFARDELAITETDRKYGGYCYSIANRILCSNEDSEETVSDTYWHTWNSIQPHRPNFLKLFLAKITRNLSLNIKIGARVLTTVNTYVTIWLQM